MIVIASLKRASRRSTVEARRGIYHLEDCSDQLLRLPDRDRDEPEAPDDGRLRARLFGRSCLSSSLLSSSPSPRSVSFTPSSAPLVFDFAPSEVTDSMSSGRPWDIWSCAMSSRLTASAKRR